MIRTAAIVLVLGGALAGCDRVKDLTRTPAPTSLPPGCAYPPHQPQAPTDPPRILRVVLSGDTRGFLVPCGCTSKQFGGLPRRATYLEQAPADLTLYVDAGGGLHRATDYDRLKGEFLWRGLVQMKLTAANLGASEIALGRETLRSRASGVPFVSTNVVARDGGQPVVPTEVRATVSGAKVILLGICSQTYKAGEGLRVEDPREAVRRALTRLRPEADLLFLLAHAPEDELQALAASFPELDAVLGTGPSQPIPPRLVEGRTVLAAASNKGKFLAEIPWTTNDGPGRWGAGPGTIVELSEDFADHPAQAQLVKEFQDALRGAALPPEKTGETVPLLAGLPPGYRYAGSAACESCHTPESRIWKDSKHAKGLETIRAKGFDADPYCLRCHTTGYGGPGGYRTAAETPALGGIGCESCHGPSQAHAAAPLREKTPARALQACLSCHDPENSPTFAADAFWPRIVHGKGRAPAPATGGGTPR